MSSYRSSHLRLLETNIDDLNPEVIPYVMERLLAAGANDVWTSPIIMKAGRPAITLSVLFLPKDEEQILAIVFSETSTLGVRLRDIERYELEREVCSVETAYGKVRIKLARDKEGALLNAAPEFTDCKEIASAQGLPLKVVYAEALRAYHDKNPS